MPGNHDHGRRYLRRLQFAQQVDAVGVGQPDIQQEQIHTRPFRHGPHLGAAADRVHLVPFPLQNHAQGTPDVLFVVHHQNASADHLNLLSGRQQHAEPGPA